MTNLASLIVIVAILFAWTGVQAGTNCRLMNLKTAKTFSLSFSKEGSCSVNAKPLKKSQCAILSRTVKDYINEKPDEKMSSPDTVLAEGEQRWSVNCGKKSSTVTVKDSDCTQVTTDDECHLSQLSPAQGLVSSVVSFKN